MICNFFRYFIVLFYIGLIVFIILYFDLGGVGVVIIVGRILYCGELSYVYNINDEVLGVMGVDFFIMYFYRYIIII